VESEWNGRRIIGRSRKPTTLGIPSIALDVTLERSLWVYLLLFGPEMNDLR